MDRIRKALDLAREMRAQPLGVSAENPHPNAAPEDPPQLAPSVEKPPSIVSIVEKPRPVVPAVESAVPSTVSPTAASAAPPTAVVRAIVEKPEPAVAAVPVAAVPVAAVPVLAVEPHGSLLRSAERFRPVVAAVAKPKPMDSALESPEAILSTLQRQPPVELAAPRPTGAAVEESRPVGATEEMPRPSAPPLQSARAPVAIPTAIQYTRTKTFSPDAAWLESNRIIDVSGTDAAAGAFRMLRTQVLQRMLEHNWRSIAVLSPRSDDGRTTTAINLAISLANDQRHTVLLVEFDLKQPIIAKRLGIDAETGADDLLRGTAGVEDCLYHPDGFDRFVVMPGRSPMDHSSEMLAGPRCREIVAELRARYPDRLLVFDLPPVLGTDDALAFVPLVECALIVVAELSTPRADLLRCMELLRNTPVVGTVLNLSTGAGAAYG